MADEKPPPKGSKDWIDDKLSKISNLTVGAGFDGRWPINQDPAPDTTSGNHQRVETWLDEQEWPSAENEWLSRRGHPLNPAAGEKYRHEWADVHDLRHIRLAGGAAVACNVEEPIGPSRPPPRWPETRPGVAEVPALEAMMPHSDPRLSRRHVIHSQHGAGGEEVELAYERALSGAGGRMGLVEDSLDPQRRRSELGRAWAPLVHQGVAAAAATAASNAQHAREQAAHVVSQTLRERRMNAPGPTAAALGWRPGSMKQRSVADNRPPVWNEDPPWGRRPRW